MNDEHIDRVKELARQYRLNLNQVHIIFAVGYDAGVNDTTEKYGRTRVRAGGSGPIRKDQLEAVAEIYKLVTEQGGYPVKAIAEKLGIGQSTASRHVRLARDYGYIT